MRVLSVVSGGKVDLAERELINRLICLGAVGESQAFDWPLGRVGRTAFIAWVVCDNVAASGLPDIGAEFYAQYKWKWLASCS